MEPLREECGSYMPGFFRMKLEFPFNDSRLVLYNLSKRNQASFFHEYFHFLQDITTFWGLNNIYVYSEFIHQANRIIYEQPKGELHLPIKIAFDKTNVAANQWALKNTIGDYEEYDTLFILKYKKKKVSIPFVCSYIKKITKIVLTIQGHHKIEFGARAIMESMAYLIEHRVAPGGRAPKEYPYLAAEFLSKFIYPDFANDDLRLIALCDVSLMFSEPGKIFVEALEEYKAENSLPSPEDIYNKYYASKILNMGYAKFLQESYLQFADMVADRLKLYMNNTPYKVPIGLNYKIVRVPPVQIAEFSHFHRSIDNLIGFGIKIRLENPFFYLKLARGGVTYDNQWLCYAVNTTGFPLIEDINHDFFKIPSSVIKDSMDIFFAIEQINNTFESGQDICGMIEICTKSQEINPPVDDRCYLYPWVRVNEANLCPYAFLWRHWNLASRQNVKID